MPLIPTTLVTSRLAPARESVIAAQIDPSIPTAVLAEGLPNGIDPFEQFVHTGSLHVIRIAPGCPCCSGHLTMQVNLNRLLRLQPQRFLIGLASSAHLDRIRLLLSSPPYNKILGLIDVISADDCC